VQGKNLPGNLEESEMAIQSNVQSDARKANARNSDAHDRTDEFHRDIVATEGTLPRATANGRAEADVSGKVLTLLEKSAQTLRHAAENVENRGLKLLLKVMAQERVYMLNQLRQAIGKAATDPLDASRKSSATTLQQGLEDIQTSMTVQRAGRENVTLGHLAQEEEALLKSYTREIEGHPSDPLRNELESQRARIAQFYTRLMAVGEGVEPIVARVFDTRIEGESAVTRLREQGLDPSQIDVATINQVTRPVLRSTANPAGPNKTMAAGAFSGAIVGGLVGLALAIYVWLSPQLEGWVTVGPWALLIGAIIIGACFGTVFGFFIGQNRKEDDLAVTADGLINGEILVVTYPLPHQVVLVEDILQVHHARELSR